MRRLLFFNGQRMLAYYWAAGEFRAAHVFESDAEGFQDFERFLRAAPKKPVRILVDLIEEGFRLDTMPHVFGRDRRAISKRVLNRHFRTSDFRQLKKQGRLRSGRKDDLVLVSGLTNPDIMKNWIAIINRTRVPLEGIYSLPVISSKLLPYMKAQKGTSLLISQQAKGVVRQTFFRRGKIKLSRLIPIRYEGDEGFTGFLTREVQNTLRFMESQRLLRRAEQLDVHVLAPDARVVDVTQAMKDDEILKFHIHGYSEIANRIGIKGDLPTKNADGLFAQLLLRRHSAENNYATKIHRTHYFHRLAGIAMHVSAAAVLLATLVFSGARMIEGRLFHSYSLSAQVETHQYQRLYDELLKEISSFPLQAAYVKDAVDLIRDLDRGIDDTPENLMARVAESLSQHPNIMVDSVDWAAGNDKETGKYTTRTNQSTDNTLSFETSIYQVARINGSVIGYGRRYRLAIEHFENFIGGMRDSGYFESVEVLRTPFDIDPDAAITGSTGTAGGAEESERASYELFVRIKVTRDAV